MRAASMIRNVPCTRCGSASLPILTSTLSRVQSLAGWHPRLIIAQQPQQHHQQQQQQQYGIESSQAVGQSSTRTRPWTGLCMAHNASSVDFSIGTGPLEYTTLAQAARMEIEVKKSRFIVTAWPITSAPQAMSLIKAASDPTASHNCFAYRVGSAYRSSDDGEPGGTAGRPILSAIEGEQLQGVAVLVTRHFGGVKLGAGGLVRAYGGAARDCLRAAPRTTVKSRLQLEMKAGYEALGVLYNLFDKYGCERLCEQYEDSSGALLLRVNIEAEKAHSFVSAVSDATSGQVMPQMYTLEAEPEAEQEA